MLLKENPHHYNTNRIDHVYRKRKKILYLHYGDVTDSLIVMRHD